jgi:hypothetical protein
MTPEPNPPAAPFPVTPIDPDLLAWAKQTLYVAEFMRDIRDIQAGGGYSFEEVLAAVERRVGGS